MYLSLHSKITCAEKISWTQSELHFQLLYYLMFHLLNCIAVLITILHILKKENSFHNVVLKNQKKIYRLFTKTKKKEEVDRVEKESSIPSSECAAYPCNVTWWENRQKGPFFLNGNCTSTIFILNNYYPETGHLRTTKHEVFIVSVVSVSAELVLLKQCPFSANLKET